MKNGELFERNIIIGIDPGPTTSGQVIVDSSIFPPIVLHANSEAKPCELVPTDFNPSIVVSEWLVSYATVVGFSVLNTALLVGIIQERAESKGMEFYKLTRPDVNLELTGLNRSKKSQVNEAIRELYRNSWGSLGGGKNPVVGIRKKPGPLYSVKSHAWDALAVVIAWLISK